MGYWRWTRRRAALNLKQHASLGRFLLIFLPVNSNLWSMSCPKSGWNENATISSVETPTVDEPVAVGQGYSRYPHFCHFESQRPRRKNGRRNRISRMRARKLLPMFWPTQSPGRVIYMVVTGLRWCYTEKSRRLYPPKIWVCSLWLPWPFRGCTKPSKPIGDDPIPIPHFWYFREYWNLHNP